MGKESGKIKHHPDRLRDGAQDQFSAGLVHPASGGIQHHQAGAARVVDPFQVQDQAAVSSPDGVDDRLEELARSRCAKPPMDPQNDSTSNDFPANLQLPCHAGHVPETGETVRNSTRPAVDSPHPINFSPGRVYFMQEPDDAALVARSASGDTGAFEVLVGRHQRVLFGVALRMLGDYSDASDATQSAFVKAYEKLATFDPRFRFFSWIYRILLNECLNARRDRRPVETLDPELAVEGGPFEAMEAAERRRLVQRALLALPVEYREVIVLRHFGELHYDDIAATLGIPSKTVKSRLYSARQRLLDLLTAGKVQ